MIDISNVSLITVGAFAAAFSAGILADMVIYGICKAFGLVKGIIK